MRLLAPLAAASSPGASLVAADAATPDGGDAGMIKFRKAHPLLGQKEFLTNQGCVWHESNWDNEGSRFLSFSLHGEGKGDLYIAFNAHHFAVDNALPAPPPGTEWRRIADTNLPSPQDLTPQGTAGVKEMYSVAPWGAIILMAM